MNILKNILSQSLLSMLLYAKNSFLLSLDFCDCLFSSSLIISLIYINQNSENKEIAFSLPQKIKSNLPACQVVEPRQLYSLGLFFIILYEPSNSNPRVYKTIQNFSLSCLNQFYRYRGPIWPCFIIPIDGFLLILRSKFWKLLWEKTEYQTFHLKSISFYT